MKEVIKKRRKIPACPFKVRSGNIYKRAYGNTETELSDTFRTSSLPGRQEKQGYDLRNGK